MFLTIIGDRIGGTDDEQTVINAFGLFDEGEGNEFCKLDQCPFF